MRKPGRQLFNGWLCDLRHAAFGVKEAPLLAEAWQHDQMNT